MEGKNREGKNEMAIEENSTYLRDAYSAKDNRALERAYDQWADKYDEHVTTFGYRIPAVAAGLIGRYLMPEIAPILDAGVGTGLMGEILEAMGYQGQIGIDMSKGMLEKAAQRNIYKTLHRMVLGEKLNFPSDYFGACQSMGVFTEGHAPASAFDELVRVVCSGGYIFFSLLDKVYDQKGYKEKFETLENDKKWQCVEKTKKFPGVPLEDPNLLHRVYVYRIR